MPHSARQFQQQSGPQLPSAITARLDAARLPATYRQTLEIIAERSTPDRAGNLVGCEGGPALERAVGSRAKLMRHVRRLEDAGVLVVVMRGGAPGSYRGQANIYAIPHSPDALESLAVDRDGRRMVPCSDGKWRPIHNSDTLFHPDDLRAPAPDSFTASQGPPSHHAGQRAGTPARSDVRADEPVDKSDTRSAKSDTRSEARFEARFRPCVTSVSPIPPSREVSDKSHTSRGDGARRANREGEALRDGSVSGGGDGVVNMQDHELRSLPALRKRFEAACRARQIDGGASDHAWLMFVAAAIFARSRQMTRGGTRGSYFAKIVRRNEYLFGECHVDDAHAWLKRDRGEETKQRRDAGPRDDCPRHQPASTPVQRVYAALRRKGFDDDAAVLQTVIAMRRLEPNVEWSADSVRDATRRQ